MLSINKSDCSSRSLLASENLLRSESNTGSDSLLELVTVQIKCNSIKIYSIIFSQSQEKIILLYKPYKKLGFLILIKLAMQGRGIWLLHNNKI
jgi:hypothetical protein